VNTPLGATIFHMILAQLNLGGTSRFFLSFNIRFSADSFLSYIGSKI
jgi:hypothetical protein